MVGKRERADEAGDGTTDAATRVQRPLLVAGLAMIGAGAGMMAARQLAARREARGEDVAAVVASRHRAVERLMDQYEAARESPEARYRLLQTLRQELAIHEMAEEQVVHPAVRRRASNGEAIVATVLEQEHAGKEILATIERLPEGDPQLEVQGERLLTAVRAHIETEETRLLPALRSSVDAARRRRMGTMFTRAERIAPTHAHPGAPDRPPGNVLLGAPVAVLDRARDAISRR